MLVAVENSLDDTDIFIGAAAVCDMRPAKPSTNKLKKSIDNLSTIALTENVDVIQAVANQTIDIHRNSIFLVYTLALQQQGGSRIYFCSEDSQQLWRSDQRHKCLCKEKEWHDKRM